ncbi:MAG: hypothetical protein PUP91_36620 [Rhizonema sp. PD37]|nr:hypothetical protein [Rhizonema sp. PD37]
MPNLTSIFLAIVLVFFGIMVLSRAPLIMTAREEVVFERVANMNKSESYHSNAVEVDGLFFETLVPERVVHVHKYEKETPVQFGFRITNQASTPYRFELQRFLPELSDPHRRLIKINGINRNTSTQAEESDIPLIIPGDSLEFLMTTKIRWYRKDWFQLLGQVMYGGFWTFNNLKPGKYQVRFSYENLLTKKEMLLYKGRTEVDSFWTGKITTPFAQLRLR